MTGFTSILKRSSDELRSFRLGNTYIALEAISCLEWSVRKKRKKYEASPFVPEMKYA